MRGNEPPGPFGSTSYRFHIKVSWPGIETTVGVSFLWRPRFKLLWKRYQMSIGLFHRFFLCIGGTIAFFYRSRRAVKSQRRAAARAGAGLDGESAYRAIIRVSAMHRVDGRCKIESNAFGPGLLCLAARAASPYITPPLGVPTNGLDQ
jgi:hypothetical protein